ncbi:uncharacterized protein TM35_000132350 [Trypanosoma theileri]|uniref:Uncharacterized protein n=1 Tax=Trypanosoma theileri TaxID=67003 RepID=A0A1X0NX99_9TRYP|nr:uncharacterized protein TM35_000132350 [Trypanosoma theileri]ORC89231.1 hypothetical protein TM35_000132350 [Trypanosoma theileri]
MATSGPVDFSNHINRRDVVVIFVDMDPSIFLTDIALPQPLASPRRQGGGVNSTMNSTLLNDSASEISETSKIGTKGSRFTTPQTRNDVIWQALYAFVIQKLRSSPNTTVSPWISIYAVYNDVIQLLEPTCGNFKAIETVIKRQMENVEKNIMQGNNKSLGPFPFNAVSHALQQIEELFNTFDKQRRRRGSSNSNSNTGGDTSRRGSNSGVVESFHNIGLKPESKKPRTLTVIQGILLLNRDSAPCNLRTFSNYNNYNNNNIVVDSKALGNGSIPLCHLDIIPVSGAILPQLPSSRLTTDRVNPASRRSSTTTNTTNTTTTTTIPDSLKIDCSCSLVELREFTGISHPGLAIGCALTKLLQPHILRGEDFFYRPIHRVTLSIPAKTARQQVNVKPSSSSVVVQQQPQQQQVTAKPSSLVSPSSVVQPPSQQQPRPPQQPSLKPKMPLPEGEYQREGGPFISEKTKTGILNGQPVQQDRRTESSKSSYMGPISTTGGTSSTTRRTVTEVIHDGKVKKPSSPHRRSSHDNYSSGNVNVNVDYTTQQPIYSGAVVGRGQVQLQPTLYPSQTNTRDDNVRRQERPPRSQGGRNNYP